jgi:hypothetical protein
MMYSKPNVEQQEIYGHEVVSAVGGHDKAGNEHCGDDLKVGAEVKRAYETAGGYGHREPAVAAVKSVVHGDTDALDDVVTFSEWFLQQ